MTITIDRPNCPSVFEADLPEIDYEHCQSPDGAHQIMARHDGGRRWPSGRTGRRC